jgi:hypothetical protein
MIVSFYFVNSQDSSIEELKGAINGMDGKMNRYDFLANYPASLIYRTTIWCVKKSSHVKQMVADNFSILNGYT